MSENKEKSDKKVEWKKRVRFVDGRYTGELVGGVPHGYGRFRYKNRNIYYGEWRYGLRHGQGTLIIPVGTRKSGVQKIYQGEFRNGRRHGIGVFKNEVGLLETQEFEKGELLAKEGQENFSEYSKNYFDKPQQVGKHAWTTNIRKLRRKQFRHGGRIPISPISNKDLSGRHPRTHPCFNARAAWNFVEFFMKMDTKWFRFDWNVCFCRVCRRGHRSSRPTGVRGGSTYAYPYGWMKFGLPIPPFFAAAGCLDDWHVGFHGTKQDTAKIIIEESRGGLLMPGDTTPSGFRLRVVNPLEVENDTRTPQEKEDWARQFFMSPSIKYCELYDQEPVAYNGDLFKVAFQVRIQPGTYKIGPETLRNKPEFEKMFVGDPNINPIDPLFEDEKLEWFTNRRNVAVLSGLMIKRVFCGDDDEKKEKMKTEVIVPLDENDDDDEDEGEEEEEEEEEMIEKMDVSLDEKTKNNNKKIEELEEMVRSQKELIQMMKKRETELLNELNQLKKKK